VLAIGLQLSAALDELHKRGIVHRSVRPDAILIDAPGTRAWLIDLGDAVRKSEAHAARVARHRSARLCGTGAE
jgi:serine/threonine protein kinase